MITDILKSSDLKDSLNESQMAQIEASFNEAVDLKAAMIANDIIAEKEIQLKEDYEAKELELIEKFEEHTSNFEDKMIEKISAFIDDKVQNFLDESTDALQNEVDSYKSHAILTIFDNMIKTAGVSAAKLVETASGDFSEDYERICEKYDAAVSEKQILIEKLVSYRKQALINEYAEGLGLVSSEKFKKIASLILENEDDEDEAKEKLDNLKKSVEKEGDSDDTDTKDAKAAKKAQKAKKSDDDSDDVDDDDIKESYHSRISQKRTGLGKDWSNF